MDGLAPGEDGQDALVAVRGLVPWGDGFLAAIETVDASGTARTSVESLGADGSVRRGPAGEPDPDGTPMGPFASLDLAAMAAPALGAEGRKAMEAALQGQAQQVACGAGVAVVLEAPSGSLDGTGQRVLRLALPPGGAAPEALDLGPLRLSYARAITGLAVLEGWIHVAVADPLRGFEVLRASATGPAAFEPVLSEGAWRFAPNAMVSAMALHPDGLLLGTMALAPGASAVGSWGPELILLRPDATWDLIFGQPRFTPAGLKRPLSGRGPGLGDPGHAGIKAIVPNLAGATLLLQGFAGEGVEDRARSRPDPFDYAEGGRVLQSDDLRGWEEMALDWPGDLGAASALGRVGAGVIVGHEGLGGEGPPTTLLTSRPRPRD